jgi:purine nucleosidase
MDPGVDDAVAIILAAASKDFELLGISTVAGNVQVRHTTENALRVLHYLGSGAPVFRGAARPLTRPHEIAYWITKLGKVVPAVEADRPQGSVPFHGEAGLGVTRLPPAKARASAISGPEAIVTMARRHAGKLTVVATGPLTNVAIACLLEPRLPQLVHQLIIMGGAYRMTKFGTGNVRPNAEFNTYCDPESARVVFDAFTGVVCVGLDITNDPRNAILQQDLRHFKDSERGRLAKELIRYSLDMYGRFEAHDPLAVYFAIEPSAFKLAAASVSVGVGRADRGRTKADGRGPGNSQAIATGVEVSKFREALFDV